MVKSCLENLNLLESMHVLTRYRALLNLPDLLFTGSYVVGNQTYYYGKISWKVAQVIVAREKVFQIWHIKGRRYDPILF